MGFCQDTYASLWGFKIICNINTETVYVCFYTLRLVIHTIGCTKKSQGQVLKHSLALYYFRIGGPPKPLMMFEKKKRKLCLIICLINVTNLSKGIVKNTYTPTIFCLSV